MTMQQCHGEMIKLRDQVMDRCDAEIMNHAMMEWQCDGYVMVGHYDAAMMRWSEGVETGSRPSRLPDFSCRAAGTRSLQPGGGYACLTQ